MLAIVFRVVFTGETLQVGELKHHVGYEVVLTQLRCTLNQCFIATGFASDAGCQCANAAGFISNRTEFVYPDDVFELGETAFEFLLAVGIPEEGRIRQTWADHFLVTGNHLCRIFRFDV